MPGEKRLLIIGIDHYKGNMFHPLVNAKRDVHRFTKVLEEKYGFVLAQDPLYDDGASNKCIVEALIDLSVSSHQDDSLIIYFAGHGWQQPNSKKGCWIPYDGEEGQRTFIFNSTVLDYIEAIHARHILLISDSCFSGTFITRRRGPGLILTPDELDEKDSRWIFVSGEETPVSDGVANEGSPFGISLCRFLEENVSPVVPASEVFDAVIRMVANKHKQQPQADFCPCDAHNGGQMVFRLTNIGGEPEAVPSPAIPFPLPETKIEYYIPRQLVHHNDNPVQDYWSFQPDVEKIYLNELVSAEKRVVILGGAGSGKSIELVNLAHALQAEGSMLNPVFKRFNTYTNENIGDYLPADWKNTDPANLLVMLDGLDEVQPQYFQTAIRKINAFAEENPLLRILISCRNNFYEAPQVNFSGTLEGFLVYDLRDISLFEIKNYAIDLYGIDGDDFIKQVYERGFLDLVQKPFFLNILIKHYSAHDDLNTSRSKIMEEALFTYYDNDKEHFNATIPVLSQSQSLKYLERIAFVLELMGKNFLTDDELEELFPNNEELTQSKYLPAFRKSTEQNKWLFEHNNLQEYIASRVLSQKPLDDIIKIIGVSAGGAKKVKPSWVNTLSFFISISDDDIANQLLNWIIANDLEVIVKFEPDRISEDRRFLLFNEIIEFYNQKEIWVYSNNFSEKELARFCQTESALNYLLESIASEVTSRIAKLNCMNVLKHFDLRFFAGYQERIKSALLNIMGEAGLTGSDIYSVLGAFSDLKIADRALMDYLVDLFGQRRNQYIRAGLYKVIVNAKLVDDYIDVFIDGIDLVDLTSPASDRGNVNLTSESDYLRAGFEMVSKPKAIKQVMDKLSSSENRREVFLSDYQEVMEALVISSIQAYAQEPSIYENVFNLLTKESLHHRKTLTNAFVRFFKETGTTWTALEQIWKSDAGSYSKGETMVLLADEKVVDTFVETYHPDAEAIQQFYQLLEWYQQQSDLIPDLLERMEQKAKGYAIVLERLKMKDWSEINAKREQRSFDLLFDDQEMLKEMENIYRAVGREVLARSDISEYNNEMRVTIEERFPNSATAILYRLSQQDQKVSYGAVKSWIESGQGYADDRIDRIYGNIVNKKMLEISQKQIDFIARWCVECGNDKRILWDFLNRFEVQLPEEVLLDFTNHISFNYDFKVSDVGSIEQLGQYVSVQKIKERVALNLQDESLGLLEWTNNAAYALRNGMVQSHSVILNKLENSKHNEYKFRDILGFWFSKVKNVSRLKKLIVNAASYDLKWKGITLLENEGKENEFLHNLLRGIVDDIEQSDDNRIYAANRLMKLNDIYGLEYLGQFIIDHPDPAFDFRISLGNIALITDIGGLHVLMKLLVIGKRPEFQGDPFKNLEERALAGISSVGAHSTENYLVVKQALELFIEQNKELLPNLNFLYYTILKIEESLKQKYSGTDTIKTAIEAYHML
jgi:hypothetical protein